MHDKEKEWRYFYFSYKKKQQPFSASTNIQLRCLIAWSKKTPLLTAYIKRLSLRDSGTLFYSKQKHLIALECFIFVYFGGSKKNAASDGLTETQPTVFVWRKDFWWLFLPGRGGARWDTREWFKALFFYYDSALHKHAARLHNLPIGMLGTPPLGREEDVPTYLDAAESTETLCTRQDLPPDSQQRAAGINLVYIRRWNWHCDGIHDDEPWGVKCKQNKSP